MIDAKGHPPERNDSLSYGIISYNDIPIKRIIGRGISVLTTDFYAMGEQAGHEILNHGPGKAMGFRIIPTKLIDRGSF